MAVTIAIMPVIKFFTEKGNAATQAYTKKPAAIGTINLKICCQASDPSTLCTKNDNPNIIAHEGKIQTSNVSIANGTPPRLNPINIMVCTEDAPGSSWQKALYSSNSSSDTYGVCLTKVFIIIAK